MGTPSYIIWIDPNIKNGFNRVYSLYLWFSFSGVNVFKDVKSAMDFLKNVKFAETKVIVSGRLYIDFIDQYEKNKGHLFTIPKIIIFTYHKEAFIKDNSRYKEIIDNQLYNYGGIQTDYEKINEFLRKKNDTIDRSSISTQLNELKKVETFAYKEKEFIEEETEEMTFDYIDYIEQLIIPIFHKVLIDMPYDSFDYYTLSFYDEFSKENSNIKQLLNQVICFKKPPIEILCKYYIRVYTMKSSFYGNLTQDLRKNIIAKYLPFIKLLYAGLKLKSLSLAEDQQLYRGTLISDKEIVKLKDYIKNKKEGLPAAIVFSKSFLSFSKERKIAFRFLKNKKDGCSRALFIVNKDKDLDYSLATHADIEEISDYQYEKEVLFFPFSSFEIKDIKEVNGNKHNKHEYEIKLLYLGKYVKEIEKNKNIVEKGIEIPESKFKEEIIKAGLIQPEKINNINTKILFSKYLEYKKDIETKKISFKDKVELEYKEYEEDHHKLEIVWLGGSSVGKSSIIKRYCKNSFDEWHIPTIEADFNFKDISFKNENINLLIWEISAQGSSTRISCEYITDAAVIILTYDVSNKSTFDIINNWLSLVKDYCNVNEKLLFLVGNKCDLDIEKKEVSYDEGLSFAKENNMIFHEVSAKTGKGIDKLFEDIIDKFITYYDKEEKKVIIKNKIFSS